MDENVSIIKKLLTKRNIFIALGVVILAEVLWAGWTLRKSTSLPQTVTPPAQISREKPTMISLKADKKDVKVGEKITVSVNISSDKLTSGTDVIINYDPKLLTPQTVGSEKTPLIAGNIYSDYPQNSVDQALGKITVAGITQAQGGILANGLFGTLVFQAKAAGLARISLDYTPGSTTDSNVTESETVEDVLGKVENLELNILP